MQLCILYCETKESDYYKSDSFSYFYVKICDENSVIDINKDSGECSDLSKFLSNMNCEVLIYTLYSFSKLSEYLSSHQNSNFKLSLLNVSLGLPENWGLYEIFSYYFDSGSIVSKDEMLDVILSSVINCDTNLQYSYCVLFFRDNVYTFSWFSIGNNSAIKILGNDSIKLNNESTKVYALGKFMKCLRYKMAKTGCNITKTQFLVWDSSCISFDISNYIIGFKSLDYIFSNIKNLSTLDYNSLMRLLSTDIKMNYNFSASEFTKVLSSSSKLLDLKSSSDGVLTYKDSFIKDYSSCISSEIDKTRAKWGIILDCEGNKDNASGLRELGGIIFYRYNNIMINVETFECGEILLEETLQQVLRNYEEHINRYIPMRGIDIYTFGSVDACMIEDSLKSVSTKQFRKRIKKLFRYQDCRDYIMSYLSAKNIDIDKKKTLSNIASSLGVQVISPKHSALCDSKTLFNVLAYILQETDEWINI